VRIRPLAALSAAALSALLLAGCSAAAPDSEPTPTETGAAAADLCDSAAPSGSVSDGIVVTGEPGSAATAEFSSPLDITSAERTVVVEGEGDPIESGDLVQYGATIFDAETGAVVESGGYDAAILPVQVSVGVGADQFFGCATEGSRIVMALPASEQAAASVWVLDVLGITPDAAWGEPQEPVDGMPTVELAEDGEPTITIPDAEAPTEVQVETLKTGDGAVVQPGDTVLVHYTGVKWSDGTVFDSSWEAGAPTSFSTTGVVEGFKQALEGQTVGSQVLVVVPPAFGYGASEGHELQDETLVFVVDILGTQSPAPAQ
jgi:hypothetical protein